MLFEIRFASDTVAGVPIDPFSVEVPDGTAGSRTVDVNRMIRARVAQIMAGHGLAVTTRSPQVYSSLSAKEGTVHDGSRTVGAFSVRAVL